MKQHHSKPDDNEEKNLVTERDNDETFGLFREDSFPEAGDDEVQKRIIHNELPRDNKLPREEQEDNEQEGKKQKDEEQQ